MCFILSPTYGKVIGIDDIRKIITVYISKDDIHNIYAPNSGTITDVTKFQSEIKRMVFKMEETKIGRVRIQVNKSIDFWVEVGYPTYIHNRVLLRKHKGDKIKSGEVIGEIVLGSLSEVHLPREATILVVLNECLIGGRSIIAK
jgi:phosphatidylserine decarboxylase